MNRSCESERTCWSIEVKKCAVVGVDRDFHSTACYHTTYLTISITPKSVRVLLISSFLASHLRPRTLPIPGFDLENVFLLRDPSQANKIAEMGAGKKVVVIGTSFIGMRDSIALLS